MPAPQPRNPSIQLLLILLQRLVPFSLLRVFELALDLLCPAGTSSGLHLLALSVANIRLAPAQSRLPKLLRGLICGVHIDTDILAASGLYAHTAIVETG